VPLVVELREHLLLDQKLSHDLVLDKGVRHSLPHLLGCKFGDLERSLESHDRDSEGIQGHQLALVADIAS
jgi:hypothetical protein